MVLVAAVVLLAAGCVQQKAPGVRIKPYEADLVYGVKPQLPVLPVALPVAPQTAPQLPPLPSGPEGPTGPPRGLTKLSALSQPSDCPAAALDAFPDQTAPVDLAGKPPVGEYRWKMTASVVTPSHRNESTVTFQHRLVRRVTPIAKLPTDNKDSSDYTFQEVWPYDTKGSVLVLSFQVRSDARTQRFVQPQTGSTATAYAASPDAGLALTAEDIIDNAGNTRQLFHPTSPLLLLPLPIHPGVMFDSSAFDPRSGTTVSIQAQVLRRGRVDACGTIIEGWLVTGTQSVTGLGNGGVSAGSGGSAASVNYTQLFATQSGAIDLEDSVQFFDNQDNQITVDDTIAQQHPAPLPPGTS